MKKLRTRLGEVIADGSISCDWKKRRARIDTSMVKEKRLRN